jgi:AraC-like DNA-binding protein
MKNEMTAGNFSSEGKNFIIATQKMNAMLLHSGRISAGNLFNIKADALPFDQKHYRMIITGLNLKTLSSIHHSTDAEDIAQVQKLTAEMEKVFSACSARGTAFILTIDATGQLCLLFTQKDSSYSAFEIAEKVHQKYLSLIPDQDHSHAFTSLTEIHNSLKQLPDAYHEARVLNDLSFFETGMHVFDIRHIYLNSGYISLTAIQSSLRKIRNLFAEGSLTDTAKQIRIHCDLLKRSLNAQYLKYTALYMNSLLLEYREVYHIGSRIHPDTYTNMEVISAERYSDISTFSASLQKAAGDIFSQLPPKRYSADVLTAVFLLESNFRGQVSLASIANDLSVSASRLSTLFNREVGCSVSEALTIMRIEHACRLLETTDMKIKEIASASGIPNTAYFLKVFHKHKKMTPGQWRESHQVS